MASFAGMMSIPPRLPEDLVSYVIQMSSIKLATPSKIVVTALIKLLLDWPLTLVAELLLRPIKSIGCEAGRVFPSELFCNGLAKG